MLFISSRFRGRIEESARTTTHDGRANIVERIWIKIRGAGFLPIHGAKTKTFGVVRTLTAAGQQEEGKRDSGDDFLVLHDSPNLLIDRANWTVLYRDGRRGC
jgi:hypothetical protein